MGSLSSMPGDGIIGKKKKLFGKVTHDLHALLGRSAQAPVRTAPRGDVAHENPVSGGGARPDPAADERIAGLRYLLESGKDFFSTLDYPHLLDLILETCVQRLKVRKAAIFVRRDPESSGFILQRSMMGFEPDHGVEYVLPESHEIIRRFAADPRCYTLEEIESSIADRFSLEPLRRLRPQFAVPLTAGGVVIGILILGGRSGDKPLGEEEREHLLQIASMAGIALRNALLFEMNTTDATTKLKMRHYYETVLLERQKEAVPARKPLSVLILDIDYFTRVNDAYGRICGDMLLRETARIVLRNIRAEDLASRYGGDVFAVLLPGADRASARVIAERIRTGIENRVFEHEDYQIRLTVSIGAAVLDPAGGTAAGSMIDRALRALSASKRGGRNRTSFDDRR